jgi:low temperature requirement protein LtrA
VTVSAALWWVYFDAALERVEDRLHAIPRGRPRNVLARDSFSFIHMPLVAGIVLLALGVKKTLEDVDDPLKTVSAAALCGGVALYLASDVAFRRRCLGLFERQRVLAALACLALLPVAFELPSLAALASVAAVCAALVAYESVGVTRARAR